MFGLFIARFVVGLVRTAESPLAKLHAATDLWAGAVRQEPMARMKLEVVVTEAEYLELVQLPQLRRARARAAAMRDAGQL
jgi:hypothetical protein